MNYQNSLLNKKGRFGPIWLAAHHPGQVNRREIIRMDLNEKCKDIVKYILNGRSKVPRFSLLISSHLMFGLVVLIDKQYKYLYDELKEFNLEMKSTYTLLSPVKQRGETPSKRGRKQLHQAGGEETIMSAKKGKAVDKRLVTLKENLPDIMDKDVSFDSLVQVEMLRLETAFEHNLDEFKRPGKSITMTDIFDERVSLIPVEQTFDDDNFGLVVGQPEGQQLALSNEDMVRNMLNMDNLEITAVPKPATPIGQDGSMVPRGVMRDISNQELARLSARKRVSYIEQTTIMGEVDDLGALDTGVKSKLQKTTIGEEESVLAQPIVDTGIGAQLDQYQDTLAAPQVTSPGTEQQTHGLPTIEETEVTVAQAVIVEAQQAQAVEEQPVLSRKKPITRKRPFIFDETTMIPEADFKKRMSREELKKDHERNLVRVKSLLLKTCYDYAFVNPFFAPSGRLASRVKYVYSNSELSRFVNCQLIGSLVPRRQEDDTFSYMPKDVKAREQMEAQGVEVIEPPMIDASIQEHASEMEIKRLTDSKTGSLISKEASVKARAGEVISSRDAGANRRSKLRTDTLPPTVESRDESGEPSGVRRRLSFEETMGPVHEIPSEFMMMPSEPAEVTMVPAEKPPAAEPVFEQMVLQFVQVASEHDEHATFQDMIRISTERPKRMFAAKAFSAMLNLCAKKSLNAEQEKFYGDIYLSLP